MKAISGPMVCLAWAYCPPAAATVEVISESIMATGQLFDVAGVVITGAVIIGYFIFMLVLSEKEYKQVIAEKFD